MRLEFRTLYANEIECRIAQAKDNGVSILLYKDARVDQNLLDETVGAMNWMRSHSRDNANCTVSIWDDEKKQWISKEDTGKESNTEAEKGLASDSFKRACFNWGIGRELYSAPFIWVDAGNAKIVQGKDGKPKCFDSFKVREIEYDANRNISKLVIIKSNGAVVYTMGGADRPAPKKDNALEEAELKSKVLAYINRHKLGAEKVQKLCAHYKITSINQLTATMCKDYIEQLEKSGGNINE